MRRIYQWDIELSPTRMLIAREVVHGDGGPQVCLCLKCIYIKPHASDVSVPISTSWSKVLEIEPARLSVEQKDVSMRRTARRRSWANIVGDKRLLRA